MRPRPLFASFTLLLFLVSCGGTGSGNEGNSSSTTARVASGLEVETLATDLDTPWEIVFVPDGRIFVTERPGRISVIEDGQARLYAQVGAREYGEGGQLGLALDPNFEKNGYLYAYYTSEENGEYVNRLVWLVERSGTIWQDKVLLEGPASSIHDGGRVAVGPDGKLYATMGDTSNSGLAQRKRVLAGKIVRLNPDGSIPEDNPFPDSPVYSYGHRNPQGLAWDEKGNLYATEHGDFAHDELNLIRPGNNYGWPVIEGDEKKAGMQTPILQSGNETWTPSGAEFVKNGPWKGSPLVRGLAGESLHRVTFELSRPDEVASHREYLRGEYGRLRTVKQGPDGALYVLTSNRDGRGDPVPEDDRLLRITVP